MNKKLTLQFPQQRIDLPRTVPIKKIIHATPLVKLYILPISLNAKPGQFINLWIPGVNERPMSIAFDNGREIMLAIAKVGETTKTLDKMKTGDYIGVRGPYGTHFSWKPKAHIAMIAGGYGAAPLYFAAYLASKQGCKIDFFLGARNKNYLLFKNKLRKLKNLKLHIATDDGSLGFKGFNTQIFNESLKNKKYSNVMTCGPELMMKKVSDICFKRKIPCQVSIERYMKCGFGICGNCCVDDLGISMCVRGPVISNKLARKIKEFGIYYRDDVGRKKYFC